MYKSNKIIKKDKNEENDSEHKQHILKRSDEWEEISKKNLLVEINKLGYFIGKKIGKGSYSKVYYAEHVTEQTKLLRNKPIACKIIDGRRTSCEYYEKFLPRELKIIQKLAHPHIVSVFSILELGPYVCFFMDYCSYGDLLDRIHLYGRLKESKSQLYFSQLTSAIHYLHTREISHRDIKCENILIFSRNCIKLSDFGFSKKLLKNSTRRFLSDTFCGSAAYAAPEVLKGIPYNPKLFDMWSLGCVLYIMVTGNMPFDDKHIPSTIIKQEDRDIYYAKDLFINPDIKEIIGQLLEPNVRKRIDTEKLLLNPWIIVS